MYKNVSSFMRNPGTIWWQNVVAKFLLMLLFVANAIFFGYRPWTSWLQPLLFILFLWWAIGAVHNFWVALRTPAEVIAREILDEMCE